MQLSKHRLFRGRKMSSADLPLQSVSQKVRIDEKPIKARRKPSNKSAKERVKSSGRSVGGGYSSGDDSENEKTPNDPIRYKKKAFAKKLPTYSERKVVSGKERKKSAPIRESSPEYEEPIKKGKSRSKSAASFKEPKKGEKYSGTKVAMNTRILTRILQSLPFTALSTAAQVNQLWSRCAKLERAKRTHSLECDCIVLELQRPGNGSYAEEGAETDLKIELRHTYSKNYSQPHQVISFLTWHTVDEAPELLFKQMPAKAYSSIFGSADGIIGTDRKGRSDAYIKDTHEAFTSLHLPKYESARILPFAANSFQELAFKEFFFDNIGIRNFDDKKLVKCILLFANSASNFNDPCYVKHTILRDLRRDYAESMFCQTCIAGSTVTFAKHGGAQTEAEGKKSTYRDDHNLKGLVFVGKHIEVKCVAFERLKMDEMTLERELQNLAIFYRNQNTDNFAFMFTGTAADYDKSILKAFKGKFPKLPLLGLRSTVSVFGHGFSSESLADRTDVQGAEMLLGDCAVIVAVKIERFVKGRQVAAAEELKQKYIRVK